MVALSEGTTLTDLRTMLDAATDLADCEAIFDHLTTLEEGDDVAEIRDDASRKIGVLEQDGREEFSDSFSGPVEIVEALADGRLKVRAIVAQVDRVNANKRLYPKDVMIEALKRANVLAKRGAISGLAGHPGFFSGADVRDVVVRWDAFMLQKNDLHAEGTTVLTDAGRDITTIWESGVALEWSIRGFGRAVEIENKKGDWTHDEIHDYILKGADVVLDGAAKTRTVSLSVESTDQPGEAGGNEMPQNTDGTPITDEAKAKAEAEALALAEATAAAETKAAEEAKAAADAKAIADAKAAQGVLDASAIAKEAAGLVEMPPGATPEQVQAIVEAQFAAKALVDHKGQLVGALAMTDEQRIPITRALNAATTIEEADGVIAEFQPYLDSVLKPEPAFQGIGVITEDRRERQYQDNWFIGDEYVERPETAEGVRQALLDSYPDNGKDGFDSPKWVFGQLLDTMWKDQDCRTYFHASSKRGIMDASTTTTALGTLHPQILPMMRRLYPMLIPYEIAGVQPLNQPTGTIHTLQFDDDGANDLSDSSNFDSTAADHTEAATKMQIVPRFTQVAVAARSKAVHYDITNELRQDIRAIHGLDADAELITAATNEIARQTNFTFLDLMRAGATAGNQTYGTNAPTGYNGQEWNDRLGAFLMKAQGQVAEKMYTVPDWIVAGPGAAGVLKSMNVGGLKASDRVDFGTGLRSIGIAGDSMIVYEATWFSRNTMLFGYRPPTWSHTGAVFSPYIALFISPEDYTASTNTLARSVSSRFAQTITNGNAFSTITVSDTSGTDITTW